MAFSMRKKGVRRQQANGENRSPSNQMICTAVYPMHCKEMGNAFPQLNFEAASTAVVRAVVEQRLQQHYSSDTTELDTCNSMLKKGITHEEVAQQHEKQAEYRMHCTVAQQHENQAKYRMHCTVVRDMHDSEYSWDS